MNSRLTRLWIVPMCGTIFAIGSTTSRGADDAASVFKLIPAEVPFAAVVINMEKFDKSVTSFAKRIDPDQADAGMLADIKSQLPVADWVDFSKPLGAAQTTIGEEPVVWVRIPEFAKKIKELKNATEEAGVWQIEKDDDTEMFIKAAGDYVLIANSKAQLEAASKPGKTVAEQIGGRISMYDGKEIVLHLNFEPIRALVLGQVAQASQMAPMFAMMAGPQMGVTDPAALGTVFSALFDGVKSFLEQVDYIELAGALDDKNADITLATGYKPGPIRSYLDAQKPADAAAFDQIEEQPFLVAASYHFPGEKSPFIDYVIEKTLGAMQPAGQPADAPAGANEDAAKAVKLARDLYSRIEGQNMVMNMSADGIRITGDYIGKDAPAILQMQKDLMTKPNALMAILSGGVKYESGAPKKVESTEVHTLSMKWDPASPAAASASKMYAKDAAHAFGVVGDRVRFAVAGEKDIEKTFAAKISKPLSSSPRVSEALGSLPARRNAILLLDLAGLAPIMAAMGGGPPPDATAAHPGPPIAISVSLSGEPARVDIRVPLKAIERTVQQLSPKQPT